MTHMRIFSGVRPTGYPQLGNYLGAIQNWIKLSAKVDETLFCIVDQHALTTLEDSKNLKENTLIMAATYIACGIDPKKSIIFAQSKVTYHTELAWYLMCLTPMGWLSRMTQFKDKAGKHKDKALAGLFTYPVLMAADILLYQATHVPVGEDQKQHVEFARDIVQVFNNRCENKILQMPEPMIQQTGARIKSLRDGTKKMSKSDISDFSKINMNDDNDLIAAKIKKAKSDADFICGTTKDLENRPELENMLTIFSLLENTSLQDALYAFEGKSFAHLKDALTQSLINHIDPIRTNVKQLLDDQPYLNSILDLGQEKANIIAKNTITTVKNALNFI